MPNYQNSNEFNNTLFSNNQLKNSINLNNHIIKAHSYKPKKNTTAYYNLKELLKSNLNSRKLESEYGLGNQEGKRAEIITNLVKTVNLAEVQVNDIKKSSNIMSKGKSLNVSVGKSN